MIIKKRFIISIIMAWLLFLTIDFLAHASVLRYFWDQGYPAFKSKQELFRLIPFGYLGFLLLTILVGWVYVRLHGKSGNTKKGIFFGALFGGLYALSTLFTWYSGLDLPLVFILLIGLVYFIEIVGIGFCFGYLMHPASIKKRVWGISGIIVFGFALSIILQNI